MTDETDQPSGDVPAEPGDVPAETGDVPAGGGGADRHEAPTPAPGRKQSKLTLAVVGLVALLAGAGTALALGNRGGSCPAKGDALKVEDTSVSTAEFDRRIEVLRALYDIRPPDDPAKLAAFRGDVAKGIAQSILVAHDVTERNLGAADKTVRDALDRFIAQRYPQDGRAQFVQALGTYGVSEDDVLDEFRRLIETRSLFQAVTSDVSVTEEQISQAFEARRERLAVPEQRQLRHLVVRTEEEAEQALVRIDGPETFQEVAGDVSLDGASKDQGGDLGTVSQAQLDPAFGSAAFAAGKGDTFGPVQTKNGWHVGLVVDVTAGRPVTLAEVHDSLRDTLVGEVGLARWSGYLAERIRTAEACYAEENRPADPKAPPADLTPTTLTTAPAATPGTSP